MQQGYKYTGLKTWTGIRNNYGMHLEDVSDYWNEHSFRYECLFEDGYYSFKPDLTGWQDGRCAFEITTPRFDDVIEVYFDYRLSRWVERVPGFADNTHYHAFMACPRPELEPLMEACIRKCRGYKAMLEDRL